MNEPTAGTSPQFARLTGVIECSSMSATIQIMSASPVFLKNLAARGVLSFGPEGIDLPLQKLNVIIGPNGSGKSNFLELLALLKASPNQLSKPMKEMGGVEEWFWKGANSQAEAVIEATIQQPPRAKMDLRHRLTITRNGPRFEVADEQIEYESPDPKEEAPYFFYDFRRGSPILKELDSQGKEEAFDRGLMRLEESILSQVSAPNRYPVLSYLQDAYSRMFLFRNWEFGPNASIRRKTEPNADNSFLHDGGGNLDVVLSTFLGQPKMDLKRHLKEIYEGVVDFAVPSGASGTLLYIEENGNKSIPKTRLSDGTLRYLCLLSVLLHPKPPPLIVIEEPEQGLHPDATLEVARLLVEASQRTQVIVTTHSKLVVDALSGLPESVVVCEMGERGTRMNRLKPEKLKPWLEEYSLGDLWMSGEIGGNRW